MSGPERSFTSPVTNRIIEIAWEDRTPFEAIKFQFGIIEKKRGNSTNGS